ncbi:hypothetical protein MPC4_70088 [Methylocella tundrae]|uniref:Uncharacterized protein n=2 Tax=Methylocella tundrae TaxID=227605 RepID=A0A8B6MB36_METTU|nr:hypothetical protein MPC4_70088 [Methylocella tundrae]
MVTLSDIDTIEFLVGRKFPPRTLAVLPSAGKTDQKVSSRLSMTERALIPMQVADHRAVLRAIPSDELEALFNRRFFHHPNADADFDHWSKAAHWTLDEAVALSFGKERKVVNSTALQTLQDVSP